MSDHQNPDGNMIEAVAQEAEACLQLEEAQLSDEFYYSCLPLCALDAVYSVGVKYKSVQNVVGRACRHFKVERRREGSAFPPRQAQLTVSTALSLVAGVTSDRLAADVFENRQRTSPQGGVLKAEAFVRFLEVLRDSGIEVLQDIPSDAARAEIGDRLTRIPGQTKHVSIAYFWMLCGDDEYIKADRMILRFLEGALGRSVSPDLATHLLREVSASLKIRFPHLTPRLLDYSIWSYQRERSADES